MAALFWISAGLTAFTHVGYAAVLWALRLVGVGDGPPAVGTAVVPLDGAGDPGDGAARADEPAPDRDAALPLVSLVVAAYDEEAVIVKKVANALALDYPRSQLEIIVASDGSADATARRARQAGADLVLELPRGGKSLTQNAAAEQATGEILAFSDANSYWEPAALRALVAAFDDPAVGYACGEVEFVDAAGDNQEGLYWRYEMGVRRLESELAGVTAGNGAIYAVRAVDYLPLGPAGSHDLSLPFLLAKRGRRAVFVPAARAREKMVPSLAGEWARKRRMMVGLWDIVVGEGMFDPRGYRPLYGFQIYSHRITRYLTPFLHLAALATSLPLARRRGGIYRLALAAQLGLLGAATLASVLPSAPFKVARYYVSMTAAIAAGLWDRFRNGVPGTWEKAEGTRGDEQGAEAQGPRDGEAPAR